MAADPESAEAVTNEIKRTTYRRAPWTSIFGALQFAKPFDSSGYAGCAALSTFLVTALIIWAAGHPHQSLSGRYAGNLRRQSRQ